jgi:hypothetical protein
LRLKTYILEHPKENLVRTIEVQSYVCAALFGSFYVLYRGFVGRFFLALLIDGLLILIAVLLTTFVGFGMRGVPLSIFLLAIVVAVCVLRARPMINIIKVGYMTQGWTVTPH